VIGLSLLFPFWHQRNNKKLLHFQRSEEDVLEELQFQPLHTVHHGLLGGSKASSSSHNNSGCLAKMAQLDHIVIGKDSNLYHSSPKRKQPLNILH